eukprot:TRINITY_DN8329_c1_g1_i1.p1 TRINITY_DN8329_c1_g1~~TRINITY_DN8329_c1_g1_i1.p1  ORF type:complete len:286 (-),score=55.82 TRINITY_DN8329_c1_g1_i1:270-1127(-)
MSVQYVSCKGKNNGCDAGNYVLGSNPYQLISNLCSIGLHSNAISRDGGFFCLTNVGMVDSFMGSTFNGIRSGDRQSKDIGLKASPLSPSLTSSHRAVVCTDCQSVEELLFEQEKAGPSHPDYKTLIQKHKERQEKDELIAKLSTEVAALKEENSALQKQVHSLEHQVVSPHKTPVLVVYENEQIKGIKKWVSEIPKEDYSTLIELGANLDLNLHITQDVVNAFKRNLVEYPLHSLFFFNIIANALLAFNFHLRTRKMIRDFFKHKGQAHLFFTVQTGPTRHLHHD